MKYTREQFEAECKLLSIKINLSDYEPTHIVAIECGGVYLTDIIRKYFPQAKYSTVRVSCYEGQDKRSIPIVSGNFKFPKTSKILVVDDLLDTGSTISIVKQNLKNREHKVAVLLFKKDCPVKPDYCIHSDVSGWCYFPWETKEYN